MPLTNEWLVCALGVPGDAKSTDLLFRRQHMQHTVIMSLLDNDGTTQSTEEVLAVVCAFPNVFVDHLCSTTADWYTSSRYATRHSVLVLGSG